MLESSVIRKGNAFLLKVNDEVLPMYGYLSYQPEKADYEAFKNVGVRLYFCTVYAGDRGINQYSGIRPFRSGFWKGYGQYDFNEPDQDFRQIVGNSRPGEVYIIPRLMVEAPSWWDSVNSNDVCRDAHGVPLHQSFHSIKWTDDVSDMMKDFQKWLEESGWDQYVIGWHIAAGNTEEFIRPCHRPDHMTDYSPCAMKDFQQWVRERYHDDLEKVNSLWTRAYDSFDDIRIPTPMDRLYANKGDFHDEVKEKYVTDYYAFMNEACAKALIRLCRAAKKATNNQQIIGAFYGYLICSAEEGQHAASIVYRSDAIDFLASPFVYTDSRAQGIDWQFQGAVDSAALHGKPWFMEADVRTFLSRPISQCMQRANPEVNKAYEGPVWYGPQDEDGSVGQMLKAFSRVLTNNTAVWWFDMWGGWYHTDRLMDFHKKAFNIYKRQTLNGGCDNASEIALFMDDNTFLQFRPGHIAELQNHEFWKQLGFIGSPYRLFMLEDLPEVDPSAFRVAMFSTPCRWTEETLKALKKWKSGNRLIVFLGPGDNGSVSGIECVKGNGLELLECNQLTGEVRTPIIRLTVHEDDIVLHEDNRGALTVVRRMPDYAVMSNIGMVPDPSLIRDLLNAAGGHLYNCSGDIVYASNTHIAIHAASDGVIRIHTPGVFNLIDEMSQKEYRMPESYLDIEMNKGETRLFKIAAVDAF